MGPQQPNRKISLVQHLKFAALDTIGAFVGTSDLTDELLDCFVVSEVQVRRDQLNQIDVIAPGVPGLPPRESG